MSNANFTKGVWRCHATSPDGAVVLCGENHNFISGKDVIYMNENVDDANLIAAAPEMYAMIESLTGELASAIIEANLWRNRLINLTTENPPDLIDGQTCHEAQLLLAKARGEE